MDVLGFLAGKASAILQSPSIDYQKFALGASWAIFGLETYILSRQLPCYSIPAPPAALAEHIPDETYKKSQAYGRDRTRFGIFKQIYNQVLNTVFISGGAYKWAWAVTGGWLAKYGLGSDRVITHSIFYATLLTAISSLPGLPVSAYNTFTIEEKHGFNKSSWGLWVTDQLKGYAIGAVIGVPVLAAFLKIIDWAADWFIPALMIFFLSFTFIMQLVYPIFIQPLFNKLDPLPEGELRERIEKLAGSLGFPLKHLYVIDGSKRSGHSNAYFYGLPWSKHIVIYDTLIEQSSPEEVEAVIAHELGHWKYAHPTKLMAVGQINLLITLSAFTLFIHNPTLFRSFGFGDDVAVRQQPVAVGFFLYQLVMNPLDPVISLFINSVTRRYEYEADRFACELNPRYKAQLSSSLIKLMNENLSNPHNDWLYSTYHHSHPTLLERLKAMEKLQLREKTSSRKEEL